MTLCWEACANTGHILDLELGQPSDHSELVMLNYSTRTGNTKLHLQTEIDKDTHTDKYTNISHDIMNFLVSFEVFTFLSYACPYFWYTWYCSC